MIAVIVPAHDEADAIGGCLASLMAAAAHPGLRGEAVQVVVALDDCTDGTAAICTAHGVSVVTVGARCVGVARAAAVEVALAAGARWIASTDADTHVPPDWLYAQLQCGADAFCGVVTVAQWQDYPQAVRLAFGGHEQACDGHPHVHGANIGFSAAAYRAAGGFSALRTGEDVALVDAMARSGARIARLASPGVVTSARRSARAPQGFSAFLKALEREVMEVGTALLSTSVVRP